MIELKSSYNFIAPLNSNVTKNVTYRNEKSNVFLLNKNFDILENYIKLHKPTINYIKQINEQLKRIKSNIKEPERVSL